jgi:hypothetical protein
VAKIPLLQPQCCDDPTVVKFTFCSPCIQPTARRTAFGKEKEKPIKCGLIET